jgi:hypothetical protein
MAKTKKKSKRYSDKQKSKLLDKYTKLRNDGKTAMVAAKDLGVPYITLRTWQKQGETAAVRAAKKGKQKSKGKTPKRFQGTVVITMADGTRVDCASPKDAATVLSSLK